MADKGKKRILPNPEEEMRKQIQTGRQKPKRKSR